MTVLLDMVCSLSLNDSVRLADGSVKIHHTAMCPKHTTRLRPYCNASARRPRRRPSSLLYSGVARPATYKRRLAYESQRQRCFCRMWMVPGAFAPG